MRFYSAGQRAAQRALGITKSAARSYVNDFVAGVDPTGTATTTYGVEDARRSGSYANTRNAVGVAGGVIGGGIAVPSVISGLLGVPAGYSRGGVGGAVSGFAKGFKRPVQSIYRGSKSLSALHAAPEVGMSAEQAQSLKTLLGDTAQGTTARNFARSKADEGAMLVGMSEDAGLLAQASKKGLTAKEFNEIDPAIRDALEEMVRTQRNTGVSQLGLAAAVGGGSAGFQYNKGRETGRYMSDNARSALAEGRPPPSQYRK